MLTLRKCSRNNKIKNRYIITMVNKTKKRNGRRQSRKMYGGVFPSINQNQYTPESEYQFQSGYPIQSGYPQEQYQKPDENDSLVAKTASIIGQKINDGLDFGVDTIASAIGANPNEGFQEVYNQALKKVIAITKVILNTKYGDELGEQLSEATLKVLGPAASRMSDILKKFIAEQEKAIIGLGANLAEDVLYPIVAPIRTLLSGLQVVENTTEAAAEVTGVFKDQVETYNSFKKHIADTWQNINNATSKVLGEPQSQKFKENMMEMQRFPEKLQGSMPQIPQSLQKYQTQVKMPQIPNMSPDSFKTYNKQAQMIGGRVSQSQSEFLSPSVNRSQILQQYGGQTHTRRRQRVRSRLTSRRR